MSQKPSFKFLGLHLFDTSRTIVLVGQALHARYCTVRGPLFPVVKLRHDLIEFHAFVVASRYSDVKGLVCWTENREYASVPP
jgi:hypothetical protein